jgi:hypothetical protein
MRHLRHSYHQHHQHYATTTSTHSDTVDHGLTWVVNIGASRHFSAAPSDYTSLALNEKPGIVSGINFKIEGSGTITFFVHGRLGKPVKMHLMGVFYVS